MIKKTMMYINFEAELTFSDQRYSTKLPFKFYDEVIPDNFSTAKSRLNSLQRKFEKDPSLFEIILTLLKIINPRV